MKKAHILILFIACCLLDTQAQDYTESEQSSIARYKELRQRFIPYRDSVTDFMGMKTIDGIVILEPLFQAVTHSSSEGYIQVRLNDKSGVVDTTGKFVIPCMWDELMMTSMDHKNPPEILARVITDAPKNNGFVQSIMYTQGRSGYVNMKNEIVVPIEYSFIELFGYGRTDDVVPFTKSKCVVTKRNWFLSKNPYKKSRWGLVNSRNEIILPDDYYTYIGFQNGPYFVAFRGKRTTVIDKTGKRYTKLKYTKRTEYGKEISKLYDEWLATQKQ